MTTAINSISKYLGILLLPFLGIISFSLLSETAVAQEVIWTGNTDTDWHNSNNWQPNRVPSGNDQAVIEPSDGKPFPIISKGDVHIARIWISRWGRGGSLTVRNNRTLTITSQTDIDQHGSLLIESGGNIHLTGGSFDMAYNNTLVDISSGSFISDVDIEILGDGFHIGTGTVTFNKDFTLPTDKVFVNESATVTVDGKADIDGTFTGEDGDITFNGATHLQSNSVFSINKGIATFNSTIETEIDGIFNGEDGKTIFNNKVNINQGAIFNLNYGEVAFKSGAFIGNNGTINLRNGTAEFEGSAKVASSGHFNVDDATVNITGDADFTSGGYLNVNNGSINVLGNASLSNGGEFTFKKGSLSVGGDASFTSGGDVYAGNAQMDFKGNLSVPYGSDFHAETSTVTFSGTGDQVIHTGGDDLTFYNVKVTSTSSLQTDGETENTVIIRNTLDIDEGGQVGVKDDDTIDIQGVLNDGGTVESIHPFVYGISTPSLNEIVVIFDKPMEPISTEQVENYSINHNISISNATLDPSDQSRLILEVSTLVDNQEYELTINDVFSAEGGEISENHIKRFRTLVDITYYSRRSGQWNNPLSWSVEGHTGPATSDIPNAQDGEDAIIGLNHTITIGSSQDISNLNELVVDHTGSLTVIAGGTLMLNEFLVIGGGSFELQEGGTLGIGSTEGIAEEGSAEGNIQTGNRSFSTAGSYIYNGSALQQTGTGFPNKVKDLRIQNSAGVQVLNNLEVEGTLYLEQGSLTIPSGKGIIANNKSIADGSLTFQRVFSGNPGWRMISSPVSASYENFLSGLLTQGYSGSDYENLQPNIMHYDETYEGTDNQRWRAPSSSSSQVPAGLGYNLYLFGEIPEDDRYNDPLPYTLSVEGQEHAGPDSQIDLNVTYTAEADTGWNLVGNPYGASIDWNDESAWNKTHIGETIYVWDPNSNSYKTWNGQTGSLGSGIISPFQAFWIKANAANPQLQVSEEAKTFGGEFVGKRIADGHPEIEVAVEHNGKSNSIFFSFFEDAKVGNDRLDGYYLQPPPDTRRYIELYSVGSKKNRYSINSLPVKFGTPIEIPISANVIEDYKRIPEAINLNISGVKNIPYSWKITLIDRKTRKEVNASEGLQYPFTTADAAPYVSDTSSVLKKTYNILAEASPEEARFALRIDPGAIGLGLPTEIDLKQNYPNPVGSQTTIRFTLPIQNEVTLEVYDILGRKVASLADNESYQAGLHSISWNVSNISNGIYIYRLITDDKIISNKLTVIK